MKLSTLNKSHMLALIGNIVTAAVTFVPAWAPEKQIILAALGGIVSNTYPLVTAIHKAVSAVEGLVTAHKVSLAELEVCAIAAAKAEIGKVDFNQLAKDALAANSVGDLEKLVESKVQAVFQRALGGTAPAPTIAPVVPLPTPPAA